MNLDEAFATCLSRGTMAPSARAPGPQIQIVSRSPTGTSETPLPPSISLARELPTQSPAVRRGIAGNIKAVASQLASAGVLKVSEEAEAMVSRLMSQNLPKPSSRRTLKPRIK